MCLLVSGAQSTYGVRAGTAAYPSEGASRDLTYILLDSGCGFSTCDRGRSSRGRWDQGSTHRGPDDRRARADADYCAAQRRVSFIKQQYQGIYTNQLDFDSAIIPGSLGVESEGDGITLITIDRGGRHIGEIITPTVRPER